MLKIRFPELYNRAKAMHEYVEDNYQLQSPFFPWMNFCINAPLRGSKRNVMLQGHADKKNGAFFVCLVLIYSLFGELFSIS